MGDPHLGGPSSNGGSSVSTEPFYKIIKRGLDVKDGKWMLEAVQRFDFRAPLDFHLQNFSLEFYLHILP